MLRCRTLGALELSDSSGREHTAVLSQPKRVALLVYLAVANPRGFHRRDSLLALFWPELDQERARAALRQALTFLRHELGEDVIRTRGADEVAVDPECFWFDAWAFDGALQAGNLEHALELYRGAFLPGFHASECGEFERWLEERRHQLRDAAGEAASRLAGRAEAAGSLTEAVRWARRALELRDDNEQALQKLLVTLDRAGDRATALHEYETFTKRLELDYQTEPSPETRAIVTDIRARQDLQQPRATPELTGGARLAEVPLTDARRKTVVLRDRRTRRLVLGLATAVALGATWWTVRGGQAGAPTRLAYPRTAVAVLPFQNLTPEGSGTGFAGGLHEELLTQLAQVAALKVISRTSVMGYVGTAKPAREIARELSVGSIVEASVQVDGNRLRVNVQLIDAATDEHLWAERYDRTLDDAFAIQSDVAQQIVAAVGGALSSPERQRLAVAPTENTEAYSFYLQGREYAARPTPSRQDLEIAQQLYERAVALDPSFALAHAALSVAHGGMYNVGYDRSSARAAQEVEEAETALRLAAELPQAHLAMGLAEQYVRRDYRRALDEYRVAAEGLPNDVEAWANIGYIHRRLGRWDEALSAFQKVTELNPRDANAFYILGGFTYQLLHRYAEAVRWYDRALSLAPDLHSAAVAKGRTYVLWQGQLDTLRAVLNRLPRDEELWGLGPTAAVHLRLLLWDRQADSVLQVLTTARARVFESYHFFWPTSLYSAWAHRLRGDGPAARAAFDSARVLLDSAVRELPDDWRVHVARGLSLAGLGRRDEAIREAAWLQHSFSYREDAADGPELAEYRALILAQAGEAEAALDEIERRLPGPSHFISVQTLRLDPLWDPIRDHPRFKALFPTHGTPP